MRAFLAVAALALLVAGSSSAARDRSGAQALADAIGTRVPGSPVDCIDPQEVRNTRIIAGTAIIYDAGNRRYVQRPRAGAASLRADDVLVSRVTGGQLCQLDTVTLVEPVTRMQRGFVVLAPFAVYGPRR